MSSLRQSAGTKGIGGKGVGGQFKAQEHSEAGFSLEALGLTRHPSEKRASMNAQDVARRARVHGAAAASLLKAYPDVVAARFVDVGSEYLHGPAGQTMPNPDYDPQPAGRNPSTLRRFELRDVLLADGTIADESNPPRFTADPDVRRHAGNFWDLAEHVFDPQNAHDPDSDELFKDHLNNQHVYFQQMVEGAPPRELGIDRWGSYYDTDTNNLVSDPTEEEKAALNGRTPEDAIKDHAAQLIKEFGRARAMRIASPYQDQEPRHKLLQQAIKKTPRNWNPFRRR